MVASGCSAGYCFDNPADLIRKVIIVVRRARLLSVDLVASLYLRLPSNNTMQHVTWRSRDCRAERSAVIAASIFLTYSQEVNGVQKIARKLAMWPGIVALGAVQRADEMQRHQTQASPYSRS